MKALMSTVLAIWRSPPNRLFSLDATSDPAPVPARMTWLGAALGMRLARKRWRSEGMEAFDRFQTPGLALPAFCLRPANGLPVRCQDQSCAGIGDLDAMPTGFEDVEKERLLDCVLVWPRLDGDAGFQENVSGTQDVLAAVQRVGDVVEAPFHAVCFLGVSEVVALVRRRQPHAGLFTGIENDLLGQAEAQIILEEFAVGLDVDGEAIEVVESAHVHATRRIALGLVLQGRTQVGRCLVPFGFVIQLDDMAVRVMEAIARSMPEFAFMPTDAGAGSFDRLDTALQGLRAACAKSRVAQGRYIRCRQLKRIALVVVPRTKIDGLTLAAALRHSHDVDKEAEAFLGLACQKLQVAEMGHIHHRFIAHAPHSPPIASWFRDDDLAPCRSR